LCKQSSEATNKRSERASAQADGIGIVLGIVLKILAACHLQIADDRITLSGYAHIVPMRTGTVPVNQLDQASADH
jgi:hypothetical protein